MIQGRHDTYYTVEEFAGMVGRADKTIQNWVAQGRMRFVYLCGVPLVSLREVEQLIEGRIPEGAERGLPAARMMNRADRVGRRQEPERHAPPSRRSPR
jgi:hypothetical protein